LKRVSALGFTSLIAILSMAYIVCLVVVERIGKQAAPDTVMLLQPGTDVFISIPLICLGFHCHCFVPLIYTEMKPALRTIPNMHKVIATTYSLCLLLYVPIGYAGYSSFGSKTGQDILKNFQSGDFFANIARMCVVTSVSFLFPICNYTVCSALYSFTRRSSPPLSQGGFNDDEDDEDDEDDDDDEDEDEDDDALMIPWRFLVVEVNYSIPGIKSHPDLNPNRRLVYLWRRLS